MFDQQAIVFKFLIEGLQGTPLLLSSLFTRKPFPPILMSIRLKHELGQDSLCKKYMNTMLQKLNKVSIQIFLSTLVLKRQVVSKEC